jgi:hypothetical protein
MIRIMRTRLVMMVSVRFDRLYPMAPNPAT